MKTKHRTICWDPAATAADNARKHLPQLADQFFLAGAAASKDTAKLKELHEFRLIVKRFRYTLELFEPLYGPALATRLSELRRLQQHLGFLNDCATTRRVILDGASRKDPFTKNLLALLKKKEKSRREKYLRYWKETFATPGAKLNWTRYLKAYAGRTSRAKDHSREESAVEAPSPEAG